MAQSFNHFPKIAAGLRPVLRQTLIPVVTLALEARVKIFAPVSSGHGDYKGGFLQSSVYAVLPGGSTDYGTTINPPGDAYLLPQEMPPNDMSGLVGVAASYAEYVNYGTRYMAANPFFDQAVETINAELDTYFARLEDLLRGLI